MSLNTTTGGERDARTLRVRSTNGAIPGRSVRHFDELPEHAQQLLVERSGRGTLVISPELASVFADEPVVVFSEYLQVDLA